MNFQFHSPDFLWLLLLVPLLAILKGKMGRAAALVFSSTALARGVSRKDKSGSGKILYALRLLALAFFIVALARPQFGKGESHIQTSGIDILLAVDFSSSMLALDFSTNPNKPVTRLDVSKAVIRDFIDKRPTDRIGLVAFAGDPYLVSPLTLNHSWLETNLDRLKIGQVPDGTAIGSAIAMCTNRLKDLPAKSRVIILLTDGINNSGKISPIAAAEAAASFNTKVYTIAAGRGGIVPTYYLNQNKQLARTHFGKLDVAQAELPVDEETLKEISAITGAKSFRASNVEALRNIYNEIDKLETTDVKMKHYARYDEHFMLPLLFGLCLIGLEQLLSNTRFRRIP